MDHDAIICRKETLIGKCEFMTPKSEGMRSDASVYSRSPPSVPSLNMKELEKIPVDPVRPPSARLSPRVAEVAEYVKGVLKDIPRAAQRFTPPADKVDVLDISDEAQDVLASLKQNQVNNELSSIVTNLNVDSKIASSNFATQNDNMAVQIASIRAMQRQVQDFINNGKKMAHHAFPGLG
eukprot:TRINITY_DN23351_c0_g1_i1.p1 TRINITY_DN23351_c0_g1~~TRINITY_DN23351_c0_g1_i1.p1  ORF type:complete len:180 (+),score=34.79 TRINITY_DN23351_c0_g1_i1:51-590(+)